MTAFRKFIERFRRVTYSGRYLPELDGLRFIAIMLVVLFIHLGSYIHDFVLGIPDESRSAVYSFFYEGSYGVCLFFMISGFILALPFAEEKLLQGKVVGLKQYFGRRLTRIEPPYIVALVLYFIMRVWVLQYESFAQLLPNFIASLLYVHNLVFNAHSAVNGVAWTLEVEVQFYILAPLLSCIFLVKNVAVRRGILVVAILAGTVFSFMQQYHIGNILNKGCYFLCGMLLADLYLLRKREYNGSVYLLLGAGCFAGSLFVPAYYISVYYCLLKIALTFLFFFFVISNATLKKWLSYPPIAIIGGMCYSIYLLHDGVLGLLRHQFARVIFTDMVWLNATIHYIIAAMIILIVSGIFFLLVEKPAMKRGWYKRTWIFR